MPTFDVHKEKSNMRKQIIAKRDAIPHELHEEKSSSICRKLIQQLDRILSSSSSTFQVAVYQPMNSEVDLREFILYAYHREVVLCFPCMTKTTVVGEEAFVQAGQHKNWVRTKEMIFRTVPESRYVKHEVPFIVNPLRVYAPEDPEIVQFPLATLDLMRMVVVPMVAYDEQKYRLGYGGGNYDTFLSPFLTALHENRRDEKTNHEACIVGAAFKEQQVDEVPRESHDLRLPDIAIA